MIEPGVRPAPAPQILVVDDDRRVLELLEIAFTAHGFRVITAADGEDAVKRAVSERPDALVLDVRLPRKSGLEVCEILRRDPEEAHVPIVLVSAAAEADARLRGLACGADDYLSKPFSPKELIARVKRLLARAAGAEDARRHAEQLQREVLRMRGEVDRAHDEARAASRLRDVATGPGRDLQRMVDVDRIARTLLTLAQTRFGLTTVGLFVRVPETGLLEPRAVRGDGLERLAGLGLEREGTLVRVLAGLGRVARREELLRLPELREPLAPFVAGGFREALALCGADDVEGVLVADERHDGAPLTREACAELEALGEIAAGALATAREVRALSDHLVTSAAGPVAPGAEPWLAEARGLLERAARATWLPPRQRELLDAACAAGLPAPDGPACERIAAVSAADPTGRARELVDLLGRATPAFEPAWRAWAWAPEQRRAALLLAVARGYVAARGDGRSEADALEEACAAAESLDPATADALRAALREPFIA